MKFCQLLGPLSDGVQLPLCRCQRRLYFCRGTPESWPEERKEILQLLNDGGYSVVDLSDDEMAKLHVRYMVGGRPSKALQERLFSFEFPESPGRC